MYIPFVHKEAVGLHFGPDCIYVAEIRTERSGVRIVWTHSEPVVASEGQSYRKALQEVASLHGKWPPVVTHLSEHDVRCVVLQSPAMKDAEEQFDWLQEEARRRLVPHMPPELLIWRHARLGGDENNYLVACARRDAIEERQRLIKEAGLVPAAILLLPAAMGNAFILDQEFVSGTSWILMSGMTPTLVRYVDGQLRQLVELPCEPTSKKALQVEMSSLLGRADVSEDVRMIRDCESTWFASGASCRPTGLIRSEEKEEVSPQAVALALTQVYRGLDRIDFLSDDEARTGRQLSERFDAIRILRPVAILFISAFVILAICQFLIDKRLADAQDEYLANAPLLLTLEEEERAVQGLEAHLRTTNQVFARRSSAASVLELIGSMTGDDLWLTEMTVERGGRSEYSEQWDLTILGVATDPGATTELLALIERCPLFRRAQLVHISRQRVSLETTVGRGLRFELVATAAPGAGPADANFRDIATGCRLPRDQSSTTT